MLTDNLEKTDFSALLDAPARPDTSRPCPCCGSMAWRQRPGPATWPMICNVCYPDPSAANRAASPASATTPGRDVAAGYQMTWGEYKPAKTQKIAG